MVQWPPGRAQNIGKDAGRGDRATGTITTQHHGNGLVIVGQHDEGVFAIPNGTERFTGRYGLYRNPRLARLNAANVAQYRTRRRGRSAARSILGAIINYLYTVIQINIFMEYVSPLEKKV